MSYILDALKKAESERNLGAVPNVHAQPQHVTHIDDGARLTRLLPWSIAALTIGLALAALAWLQPWHARVSDPVPVQISTPVTVANNNAAGDAPVVATPNPITPTTAPTNIAQNTPAPAPAPAIATAAAPVTPMTTATQAKPSQPIAETRHTPPDVASVKSEPVKPAEKPVAPPSGKNVQAEPSTPPATIKQAQTAVNDVSPAQQKPAEPKTAAKSDNVDNEVGTSRDLPAAIQSQLPAVTVNGYIYAKDPSDRSVLMNQKLLHEGDTVATDLTLEKLLPKGAILNYRGYRYRVAF